MSRHGDVQFCDVFTKSGVAERKTQAVASCNINKCQVLLDINKCCAVSRNIFVKKHRARACGSQAIVLYLS